LSNKGLSTKRNDFSSTIVSETWQRQNGKCVNCGNRFERSEMQADHKDGDRSNNTLENCELLCQPCHSATFHSADRESYLADLGFLKEKIRLTIDLALDRKTNGTVIDAVHSLLKEYKILADEITKLSGGENVLLTEAPKSKEIQDLEAELERVTLQRRIEDLKNPVSETKQYQQGFEAGLRQGADIGRQMEAKKRA